MQSHALERALGSALFISVIVAATAATVDIALFAPSPLLLPPSALVLPPSATRLLIYSDPRIVGPSRRSALDQGEPQPATRRALGTACSVHVTPLLRLERLGPRACRLGGARLLLQPHAVSAWRHARRG